MPTFDLSDEEHGVVVALLRRILYQNKFASTPQLATLNSALQKLDPKRTQSPTSSVPWMISRQTQKHDGPGRRK